jgi:hypothetical protein
MTGTNPASRPPAPPAPSSAAAAVPAVARGSDRRWIPALAVAWAVLATGGAAVFGQGTPPAAPAPAAASAPAAAGEAEVIAAVRKAAAGYAAAFNARDAAALAAEWTEGAELDEGGLVIKGREAIVASLVRWRSLHPDAKLAIDVTGVQPLGATAARVQGTLSFTPRAGAEPAVSRFDSLRVLDGGGWRIAESRVVPTPRAALADLGWMVGTWRADAGPGGTIDATYEKALDGHAIVGRIRIARKDGTKLEALDLIHADDRTGRVRSILLDSAGARAEGEFSSDGTSFNRTLEGVPADPRLGSSVRWVQVIAPAGPDGLLVHAIDRTVDGRPVADREPVHFRRVNAAQPSR